MSEKRKNSSLFVYDFPSRCAAASRPHPGHARCSSRAFTMLSRLSCCPQTFIYCILVSVSSEPTRLSAKSPHERLRLVRQSSSRGVLSTVVTVLLLWWWWSHRRAGQHHRSQHAHVGGGGGAAAHDMASMDHRAFIATNHSMKQSTLKEKDVEEAAPANGADGEAGHLESQLASETTEQAPRNLTTQPKHLRTEHLEATGMHNRTSRQRNESRTRL